jgi:hypothetical protein
MTAFGQSPVGLSCPQESTWSVALAIQVSATNLLEKSGSAGRRS